MKSKSIFLIAISLGFGLVAAIGITQVMGNKSEGNAKVEIKKSPVVIAKEDMGIGKPLTAEMFVVEEWPVDIIPEGVVTSLDAFSKQTMVNRSRLGKRGPVYQDDIVPETEYKPFNIPRGFKVVGVNLNADDTIYGLLQPGDMIDLIAVFSAKRGQGNTSVKTFMKKVAVYSVASQTDRDVNREGTGKSKTVVGLLVTEYQSEQIALVQETAELRVVLRSQEEEDPNEMAYASDDQAAVAAAGNRNSPGGSRSGFPFESMFSGPPKTQTAPTPRPTGHVMTVHSGESTVRYQFNGKVVTQIGDAPKSGMPKPSQNVPAMSPNSNEPKDSSEFESFNGELDSEPQI